MTTQYKRLYRSRRDKMIGGVCGGIAEYFNADPTVIRLLAVLGLAIGGGTFLAYLVMLIVVPEEPFNAPVTPPNPPTPPTPPSPPKP
jgi:phage shock protein C